MNSVFCGLLIVLVVVDLFFRRRQSQRIDAAFDGVPAEADDNHVVTYIHDRCREEFTIRGPWTEQDFREFVKSVKSHAWFCTWTRRKWAEKR